MYCLCYSILLRLHIFAAPRRLQPRSDSCRYLLQSLAHEYMCGCACRRPLPTTRTRSQPSQAKGGDKCRKTNFYRDSFEIMVSIWPRYACCKIRNACRPNSAISVIFSFTLSNGLQARQFVRDFIAKTMISQRMETD